MAHEIVMPQLGLTMTEGAVTTWVKQPGDHVAKGEVVFTVETDKSEMEVESFGVGYRSAPLVETGLVVPVGTVLAYLTEQAGDPLPVRSAPEASGAADAEAEAPAPAVDATIAAAQTGAPSAEPRTTERAPISPRARALAAQLGIDLVTLSPAIGARITEDDVRREQARLRAAVPAGRRLSAIRKITAKRLTASFQTAPHFYLGVDADGTELVRWREQLLPEIEQAAGVRVTYTDFFIQALARALSRHPDVNAFWQDGDVASRDAVNVSFAVDTPDGLLAPVIQHADRLDLAALARERSRLVERARAGTLGPSETENGSATLSNLGAYGVDWFEAILNPPQSVILAIGRLAARPVAVAGAVEVRSCVTLTLSADHRVIDGVAAARFLSAVRELIEKPAS